VQASNDGSPVAFGCHHPSIDDPTPMRHKSLRLMPFARHKTFILELISRLGIRGRRFARLASCPEFHRGSRMSEKQKKKIKSLKKELKSLKSQMKKLKLTSATEKKSEVVKASAAASKSPAPLAPTLAPKSDKPAESPRDAKTPAARIGGQH
jgi:hypothetical protein